MVPGSVYTAADLWHALLMSSANDAATGLAAMAGGTDPATARMLETARALGAADTTARNTSGLDEPSQASSAYDLALFGRAALADPEITRYVRTRSYGFPGPGTAVAAPGRKSFQIQNHDRLLYNYPGALGIKNGWTSTTGGSFVGAAERHGRRLIVTVLAADPQTWRMCASLLDWGFAATTADAEPVGTLVTGPPQKAPPAAEVARTPGGVRNDPLGAGEMAALGVGAASLLLAGGLWRRKAHSPRRDGSGHRTGTDRTGTDLDDTWRRRRYR